MKSISKDIEFILSTKDKTNSCNKNLYLEYLVLKHDIKTKLRTFHDPYKALEFILNDPKVLSPDVIINCKRKLKRNENKEGCNVK